MNKIRLFATGITIILSCSVLMAQYSEIGAANIKDTLIPEYQESDDYSLPESSILLANDFIFSLSVSYERVFSFQNDLHIALRGGPAYTAESGDDLALIGQVGILAGKTVHFFDAGVGYYHNITFPDAFIVPVLGYRYMGKKGLSFKVYGDLSMDIIDSEEWGFLNAGVHISIGYRIRL